MKESAQAALSYVRTNANQLEIFSSVFEKTDIHIHVPSGAVPKDGPSAGVTIATSIVSAFTSIPVRKEVAMTGEITLRGKVLAIGGLKEKLLAAKRGLISTVIIPHKNKKDLSEISEEIQSGLEIIPVQTVEKVLEIALERMPIAVIDPEPEVEENMKVARPEAAILPQTDPPESPRTYDA
jgi:ATP-dependent Lon protease